MTSASALVAGDGGADVGEELFVVPGLLDEVFGAGADGVDDIAYRAEGGDHDDRQVGVHCQMRGSRSMPDSPGSARSSSSKIELVVGEDFEALDAVGGERDGEAFEGEQGFERLADRWFRECCVRHGLVSLWPHRLSWL
jgi:hypothetical protein